MERAERRALWIAGVGHVLLFGALSLNLIHAKRTLPPVEEAIPVEITNVALQSASREQLAAPEQAPVAQTPPPEPEAVEPSETPPPPEPVSDTPPPKPAPEKPKPPKPVPKPAEKPVPKPATKPAPPAKEKQRIDKDWLASVIGKSKPDASPAALSGAQAASLGQAIRRQIQPCWSPPQGLDVDLLVTALRVELRRDGSIIGTPEVVSQSGVTPQNRLYLRQHADAAQRAILRCAPLELPAELYEHWRLLEPLNFDARLG